MNEYFSANEIENIKTGVICILSIAYLVSIYLFFTLTRIFKEYKYSVEESIKYRDLINGTQEEIIEILKDKAEQSSKNKELLDETMDLLDRTVKSNKDLIQFNQKLIDKIQLMESKYEVNKSDLVERVQDWADDKREQREQSEHIESKEVNDGK